MIKNNYTYEYVKEYFLKYGYILKSDKYINNTTKLSFTDVDGFMYYCNFRDFLICNHSKKFSKLNPYTIQNIKLWLQSHNKNFELVSNIYDRANNNLKWKCLNSCCKEIFKSSWNPILRGCGCPFCAGKQVGLSNCLAIKNPELSLEWHPTLNGDLTPYKVTVNSGKDIWWQCSKNCKHVWKQKINIRANGHSCPYCSGRYPSEDNNLLFYNPKLCEEWDYKKNKKLPSEYTPNSGQYAWWVCKKCRHEWKTMISARSSGTGCPECNESKGEKKIKEFFDLKNICYIPQKEFNGLTGVGGCLLSYDFYLPQYNLLLEYQGEYHHKKQSHVSIKKFKTQQEHDKRKKEFSKNNNINFLEIWYWDFDIIEDILNNYLKENIIYGN